MPQPGVVVEEISIHAPREGGDEFGPSVALIRLISIHAPREGGDVRLVPIQDRG